MKVTHVINGVPKMVLIPENDIDELLLKQLNGATLSMISDNVQILGQRMENAGVISINNVPLAPKEDYPPTPKQ